MILILLLTSSIKTFHGHKYDLIYHPHVLEHITNPIQFLSYVSNLLQREVTYLLKLPA